MTNSHDNTVSVISDKTNQLLSNIVVGSSPIGVAVNPKTNLIYIADRDSNTTSIINGTTNIVIKTVPVGASPPSYRY